MPLALLLFLVCAALSAVVLSAATASTGRYSQLVDMEQRYYSVMSAAGLIRDDLNDTTVTLTRTKTTTYPASGSPTVVFAEPTYDFERDSSGDDSALGSVLLEKAIAALIVTPVPGDAEEGADGDVDGGADDDAPSNLGEVSWDWSLGLGTKPENRTLTLSVAEGGTENETLQVEIVQVTDAEGNMDLTLKNLKNPEEEPSDPTYAVRLSLAPTVETTEKRETTNDSAGTVVIDTKTTTFKWKAAGIEKV